MRRLPVRLVLSHLVVAVVGVAATYLVVRLLAPLLFDQSLRMGQGPGAGGPGMGSGGLRAQVSAAVDSAVLVGALVGAVAATGLGALIAWRLSRPLQAVRDAARAIASGRYDTQLPSSTTTELDDLARDVASLGRTLGQTEAMRLRLLGEVAHEMRTPLTVIDGTIEAMIDRVIPTGPDELGVVSGEVRRLRRLADDLSQLSRADEGRLDLRRAPVDLGDVVRTAAERLRAQVEDAGLTLTVETEGPPVQATVDRDRIAQVVTNLVGNAIRATPSGGTITVTTRRDATGAEIVVVDTGDGIAADDLERIFERFYRAHGSAAGGSGIGLTIARRIMAAHGGTLVAASAGRGQGARFTARVPD